MDLKFFCSCNWKQQNHFFRPNKFWISDLFQRILSSSQLTAARQRVQFACRRVMKLQPLASAPLIISFKYYHTIIFKFISLSNTIKEAALNIHSKVLCCICNRSSKNKWNVIINGKRPRGGELCPRRNPTSLHHDDGPHNKSVIRSQLKDTVQIFITATLNVDSGAMTAR